jgi:hypothetical protein
MTTDTTELGPGAAVLKKTLDEGVESMEANGASGIELLAFRIAGDRMVEHIQLLEEYNDELIEEAKPGSPDPDRYILIDEYAVPMATFLAVWAGDWTEDEYDDGGDGE